MGKINHFHRTIHEEAFLFHSPDLFAPEVKREGLLTQSLTFLPQEASIQIAVAERKHTIKHFVLLRRLSQEEEERVIVIVVVVGEGYAEAGCKRQQR